MYRIKESKCGGLFCISLYVKTDKRTLVFYLMDEEEEEEEEEEDSDGWRPTEFTWSPVYSDAAFYPTRARAQGVAAACMAHGQLTRKVAIDGV